MGREKLDKEVEITKVIKRLRKARRTDELMIKYSDEHKALIKNSQYKVLKFNPKKDPTINI